MGATTGFPNQHYDDYPTTKREVTVARAAYAHGYYDCAQGRGNSITSRYPCGARKAPPGQPDIASTEITDFISFFSCVHKGYIQYDEDVGVFYAAHAIKRWVYALHRACES